MKAAAIVAITGALVLSAGATRVCAEPLKYLGKHPADPAQGVVEQNGVQYSVAPGSDVPGWGQVREIADDTLVIDRHLTDAEKDDLRARGAQVYDISRVRVPREDLRVRSR
jgi:hypothetical protein